MSSTDEQEKADPSEETVSSSSDGTYTEETTPSSESESSFTDHCEQFNYDEATGEYSVKDWPDEVWKERYDFVRHSKQDTCYVMDDDGSSQ